MNQPQQQQPPTDPDPVRPHSPALHEFAAAVGTTGDVVVRGGQTQWSVGGPPAATAREVIAPGGISSFEPADMVVRCGAGTTLAELAQTLNQGNQMIPFDLPEPERATVGGALAVGHSGSRRLRYGPIRDFLLEVTYVDSHGQLIRSGGPTVKNVSGFDLCRLMVGSLGTLGCLAEVVLRCVPQPPHSQWFEAQRGANSSGADPSPAKADPLALLGSLWQPSGILWNGHQSWVLLEGQPEDVAAQAQANQLLPCDAPPTPEAFPNCQRLSISPAKLPALSQHYQPGSFLAEVGVGVVWVPGDQPLPADLLPANDARSLELQQVIKAQFDPTNRLNPGRSVWRNYA